jgi:hypothetical protein
MLQPNSAPTSTPPTLPHLDPGAWSLASNALWPLLALLVFLIYRRRIAGLVDAIGLRIQRGARVKFFNFELESLRVPDVALPTATATTISATRDSSGEWKVARNRGYADARNVFIAHRLFPSTVPGQLYDILVYLVPHRDRNGTLANVNSVEYYFGESWGDQVFKSTDRGKRFAVVISSYGAGFLCTAKLTFNDGTSTETWRFIDFEMGPLGYTPGKTKPSDAAA